MNEEEEICKIVKFIRNYLREDEKVVIPVSGGIDSDVVARLCYKAIGRDRIKLFVVKEGIKEEFLKNARELAKDLNINLTEIPLDGKSLELIKILEKVEIDNIFSSTSFLDTGKTKGSLRSAIISCYQDKGYIIAGATNRTEYELGFFMTFGDNLANFKPIEHLYKTEVMKIAKHLGTNQKVILQQPSADFWDEQEDLEDIAYWIINEGPILKARKFTNKEIERANFIRENLTWEKIDTCLEMIRKNRSICDIAIYIDLPVEIVRGIYKVTEKAKIYKSREILVSLRK